MRSKTIWLVSSGGLAVEHDGDAILVAAWSERARVERHVATEAVAAWQVVPSSP